MMNQDLKKTFSHLLTTNNPPDALQAAVFRGELDSLTTRVSELRSLLKDLEDRICQRRTILSPLRRIPLDMLGEIFKVTIPECMDKVGRAQLVDLGLVCRSWLDAARLTHQLWSKVRITGESLTSLSYEKMASWIGRSGGIPKTLEIINIDTGREVNTLVKLWTDGLSVDTLSLHFNHFRALQSVLGQLVSSGQVGCPTRSLNLYFSLQHDAARLDRAEAFFNLLPNTVTSFHLRFLSTSCICGFPFPPTAFLNRLTSLSLPADALGTKLSTALTHCANLETLDLDLYEYSTCIPDKEGDNVSLPKLQTLYLRRVTYVGFSILFRLATPALINLDIECKDASLHNDSGGQLARAMKGFTERCHTEKGQLRSLRLCHWKIYLSTTAPFADILLCLSSLTKLTFDGNMRLPQSDDFVNGFKNHLRCLEALEILGEFDSRYLELDKALLKSFAKGEWPGGLRKVVFSNRKRDTVESHPATRKLRTAGVQVAFAGSPLLLRRSKGR